MLKSMTGFGLAEKMIDGYLVKAQLRAVNHRYADFTIKTPKYYAFLEDKIRKEAMQSISRGKVEIFVSIEQKEDSDREITLNRAVAEGYIKALRELKEFGIADDLSISSMVRINDIFDVEYKEIDEEKITAMAIEVFNEALEGFIAMRCDEGKNLELSLREHLASIGDEIEFIEKRSPECVEEYRARLRKKLDEILSGHVADENRIITEAAIFADKISVDEEMVRLKSHITAFEKAMQADEPIGKKLDFIVQEMNREANTTGSKCNDAEVSAHVVELKSIIEKIREQIQNVE